MTRPDAAGKPHPAVRGLGIAAVLVAGAATLFLLIDHAAAVGRAPDESARILTLEEQARTDAAAAETLEIERERQTKVSLDRKDRGYVLGWVLLAAGAVGIACGKKWYDARPPAIPELDRLIADRFPPPATGLSPRGTDDDAQVAEAAYVDELVVRFGRGREAAIPILQGVQERFRYLPDDALTRICESTDISPAQLAGTSSFYAQFRRSPVGRHVVRVCHGTACHVAGAGQITAELRRHLAIPEDQDTDAAKFFTIDSVACLGCCSLAPVLMVGEDTAGRLSPAAARNVVDALEPNR